MTSDLTTSVSGCSGLAGRSARPLGGVEGVCGSVLVSSRPIFIKFWKSSCVNSERKTREKGVRNNRLTD